MKTKNIMSNNGSGRKQRTDLPLELTISSAVKQNIEKK